MVLKKNFPTVLVNGGKIRDPPPSVATLLTRNAQKEVHDHLSVESKPGVGALLIRGEANHIRAIPKPCLSPFETAIQTVFGMLI